MCFHFRWMGNFFPLDWPGVAFPLYFVIFHGWYWQQQTWHNNFSERVSVTAVNEGKEMSHVLTDRHVLRPCQGRHLLHHLGHDLLEGEADNLCLNSFFGSGPSRLAKVVSVSHWTEILTTSRRLGFFFYEERSKFYFPILILLLLLVIPGEKVVDMSEQNPR